MPALIRRNMTVLFLAQILLCPCVASAGSVMIELKDAVNRDIHKILISPTAIKIENARSITLIRVDKSKVY